MEPEGCGSKQFLHSNRGNDHEEDGNFTMINGRRGKECQGAAVNFSVLEFLDYLKYLNLWVKKQKMWADRDLNLGLLKKQLLFYCVPHTKTPLFEVPFAQEAEGDKTRETKNFADTRS